MTGTRNADRLLTLEYFLSQHGAVIDAAVRAYAEDMTGEGKRFRSQIATAAPERQNGLLYIAETMEESARLALRALEAFRRLYDYEENEEDKA